MKFGIVFTGLIIVSYLVFSFIAKIDNWQYDSHDDDNET